MKRVIQEKAIRSIVNMESRIKKCNRCHEKYTCFHGPALGRGDVNAEIAVVFYNQNPFAGDYEMILAMRKQLRRLVGKECGIYHTFLVRCRPSLCAHKKTKSALVEGKMVTPDGFCMLTGSECDGMQIESDDNDALNCMHYLLEELDVLNPKAIISVGEAASSYIFRAFGCLKGMQMPFDEAKNQLFHAGKKMLIAAEMPEIDLLDPFYGLEDSFALMRKSWNRK